MTRTPTPSVTPSVALLTMPSSMPMELVARYSKYRSAYSPPAESASLRYDSRSRSVMPNRRAKSDAEKPILRAYHAVFDSRSLRLSDLKIADKLWTMTSGMIGVSAFLLFAATAAGAPVEVRYSEVSEHRLLRLRPIRTDGPRHRTSVKLSVVVDPEGKVESVQATS